MNVSPWGRKRRRVKKGEVVLAGEKRLASDGNGDGRRGGVGGVWAIGGREPSVQLRVSHRD